MVKYGDSHLYDDDHLYGRIPPTLLEAQESRHRQTALRVTVVDEQTNLWEHHAGAHLYEEGLGKFYADNGGNYRTPDIEFWAYRGWHSMEVLPNGDIIRTRVGDPTDASDRRVWIQTVTDPENLSQWTSWSVLYGGSHYGAATIVVTGASTYDIYHFKNTGDLYINNSAVIDVAAEVGSSREPLIWTPVQGRPGSGYITTIRRSHIDGRRATDMYYVDDAPASDPLQYDRMNYEWHRGGLCAIEVTNSLIARIGALQLHFNPRDADHGVAMFYCEQSEISTENRLSQPYIIRGIGGGAGGNYIVGLRVVQLSDGYYYLSGSEVHHDEEGEIVTPLGFGLPIWMRSKNLKHWSDPVIGPPVENAGSASGLIELDGYIYWADSEVVWRRPIGTVTYDISNYIPTLEFDLPRDNQAGSGRAVIANPGGINNFLEELNDREIIIEPGLMTSSGAYEYSKFDRFWIKRQNKAVQGKTNRINLEFGNIWERLDTSMRDVTNHVGQVDWHDWEPGARNKAFNYFFATDTAPVETTDKRLTTRGICLYTGWKGHNSDVTVHFSGYTGNPRIIVRYTDANNYMFWEYDQSGGEVCLNQYVDGELFGINCYSVPSDSTPKIRVRNTWNFYELWFNNVKIIDDALLDGNYDDLPNNIRPGYVGFSSSSGSYTISGFNLSDWEFPLITEDLVRIALASGDFHDVIVGGGDSRILAVVWGPQTDAQTLADALRTSLEIDKLQLIWRNGSVEVGKFNNEESQKTIENEVIDSEQIDEANRRINLAVVDGNTDFWLEVDTADTIERGRQITSYFDVPELLDEDAVKARAKEEIKRGAQGASPGGSTPLFFDLWRMDAITWIDPEGNEKLVRIEGFSVDIDQGKKPHQRQTFDTAEYPQETSDGLNRPPPKVVGLP